MQSVSDFNIDTDYIDHVLIQIILQVLDKKLGLNVDYYKIQECLSVVLHPDIPEMELFNFEEFPLEYSDDMGMSEEEYKKVKQRYLKYQTCNKMLQDLTSFYTISK